jgi:hypothetical protein
MTVDRDTPLFFDASCLIAAAGSPAGGSGFQLSLCRRCFLLGAVSHLVLLEAERNIRAKMSLEALAMFQELLAISYFTVVPIPAETESSRCGEIVSQKDAHVLAATLAVHAPILLTLDRPLAADSNLAPLSGTRMAPTGSAVRTESGTSPPQGLPSGESAPRPISLSIHSRIAAQADDSGCCRSARWSDC